jgi:regulator of protease activity HflC (stomatin/prohibitin superfamily)
MSSPSPTNPTQAVNRERTVSTISGWFVLIFVLLVIFGDPIYMATKPGDLAIFGGILAFVFAVFLLNGFFTLQPNEARVLILFGRYKGTVRSSGFHWANPFYSRGRMLITAAGTTATSKFTQRNTISLRARTLNGQPLKVNDKRGNPIEIGAVVIWHVSDTAQALFDVDNYEIFVPIQSESALRHIANQYSYDDGDGHETSLRSNVDGVSQSLREELQERCARAGVIIDETRLSHLAYAPEIAQVMLRRQQAEAVIAARQRIVEGAVGMVDMALRELAEKSVIELDGERRAAMVSNLMVVLCSESEVHPVVNTGTLYT